MALHLRTARWTGVHLADRGPRPTTLVLAAGVAALLAGMTLIGASLAPMFGLGGDTSTVVQPLQRAANAGPGDVGSSVAAGLTTTAPTVLDGPLNGVAFTMRVASLGYSATVYQGTDEKTLLRGPGHYPATAWPGHPGNVGIAAHNVYWLSFSRLKAGDRVELKTRRGLFVYQITGVAVTQPSDRTVLGTTSEHRLTLTTCYPLWAGAFATQRLIFFAQEIGGVE